MAVKDGVEGGDHEPDAGQDRTGETWKWGRAQDVDEQRLYFIDSFGSNVFRCTADGGEVRAWDVPAKIGSMALRRQGGAVILARRDNSTLVMRPSACNSARMRRSMASSFRFSKQGS